jgi:hypothetical protein
LQLAEVPPSAATLAGSATAQRTPLRFYMKSCSRVTSTTTTVRFVYSFQEATNTMSKPSRRTQTSGKLFQVFTDDQSVPVLAPRKARSAKPTQDKENVLAGTKTKPTPFQSKRPFDLCSPERPDEVPSQKLGFYAESPSKAALSSRSQNGGPIRTGDPSKKVPQKKTRLAEINIEQDSKWPSQPPILASPVLANVSEAFTGHNGFHFSPLVGCLPPVRSLHLTLFRTGTGRQRSPERPLGRCRHRHGHGHACAFKSQPRLCRPRGRAHGLAHRGHRHAVRLAHQALAPSCRQAITIAHVASPISLA